MTFDDIAREARTLPVDQRKRLIMLLGDSLTDPQAGEKSHNILEFEGVGEHVRDDEDAQEHINRLRDEWDH